MIPIRLLVFSLAVVANGAVALALDQRPYDADALHAAQAAGQPTVLHVTAPWCPTCRSQHEAIDSLAAKPEFASLIVYKIDFDTQEAVWQRLNARTQSTLIVYLGDKEVGRSVGETKAAAIDTLFKSALKR